MRRARLRRALAFASLPLALVLGWSAWRGLGVGKRLQTGVFSATAAPVPSQSFEHVVFSKCAAVRVGPVCELNGPTTLTLWLAEAAGEPHSFEAGGRVLQPASRSVVAGGVRYTLEVAPADAGLRIVVGERSWLLPLEPAARNDVLERADALRRSGQLKPALALLEPLEGGAADVPRVRARGLRARIELAQGNARVAADGLRSTLEEWVALGRISDAVRDAFALSFVQTVHLNDLLGAQATLARASKFGEVDAAALGWHANASGLLARSTQDWAGAEQYFRRAVTYAERVDDAAQRREATLHWAQALGSLGQLAKAVGLVQGVLTQAAGASACELGPLHANLGSLGLRALERYGPLVDVQGELEQAAELDRQCGRAFYRRYDAVNLGLWELEQGHTAQARAQLSELASIQGGESTWLATWEAELAGRIALAQSELATAARQFEHELALAAASTDTEGAARGQLGRAEVLLRQGAFAAGLAALREADARAAASAGVLAFGSQRDGGLGRQDAAARRLVSVLVQQGDVSGAFAAGLAAYRRSLGERTQASRIQALSPDERRTWDEHVAAFQAVRAQLEAESSDDWRLSSDRIRLLAQAREEKLRAAREQLRLARAVLEQGTPNDAAELVQDERDVLLLLLPGPAGEWFSFARWQGTLAVSRVPRLAVPVVNGTSQLLAPLVALRPRRVLVLAYGKAQDLDIASLPLEGGPLGERATVVYALGLAGPDAQQRTASMAVSIVADPRGDLPATRIEAQAIAEKLALGADVLWLGTRADRRGVLDALHADWFHYAGHGAAEGSDGLGGLLLSDGDQLLPSDILALERAPRRVVLSACDAARNEAGPWTAGFSVAHAFVVAGSAEVLAPVRPIADETAATLMRWLYEALREYPSEGLAEGLSRIQRKARAAGVPEADAFRVFMP